jgi:hypothetical protein
MAFMQSSGGSGEFTVYVKYNAKAGRWYSKDDTPDATEFEVADMTAVFDFERLQTGWFLFEAGSAPDKAMDAALGVPSPKPSEYHKRGFQILVFSTKNLGGVREFSSTAGVVIDAMNLLYDDYMAAPERAEGKYPVVKCTGVTPITGKHGTNYAPTLAIVAWVAPPEALTAKAVDAPAPKAAAPAPAPAAAPAAHRPPPAAKAPAPKQPVGADEEMF